MSHAPNAPLTEKTHTLSHFEFANGQQIDELKIHYYTLGEPTRDAQGEINNAVLLLHNTTGSAKEWLEGAMADELFGEGDALGSAQALT
jgi:homoserine O-acetyltransferase